MEKIPYTERSNTFEALLSEHQDGLLFADRLRIGLNNKTSRNELAKYMRWYWRCHIRPHFFQEEKILLPLLAPDHPLSHKVKTDHDEIRELMLLIDMEADSFDIKKLAKLIESHIIWEEKQLFPYYEKFLTASQLADLKKELNDHPVDCKESWKNVFWHSTELNQVNDSSTSFSACHL